MPSPIHDFLRDNDTSHDYVELVKRLRNREEVHLVFEWDGKSLLGFAMYIGCENIELFTICVDHTVMLQCNDAKAFMVDCDRLNVIFADPNDFLRKTRKLLEISKNAAEFCPITVPLNTLDDVEAMIEVMEKAGISVIN